MPDLLDQYLAGEKEKEPDLLEQYLATKPIEEEVPAKEPTWWEAAFAPPKEYKEVYAPELGKMVPGERVEEPLGTKIIERLKFEWESDWPQWLGLGIYLGTYGLFKYVPIRGETLINRAAKSFAKNNLAALQKRAPDVINTLDDATTYSEMGLKQKLYQATADMKGGDALKTITKVTDFVSKQKLPTPETLPMLAQKITGVPSVALTDKLVHAGLDKIGAEALAGSMNLMKEGINKLVVGQVIDDFVDRNVARAKELAPVTPEEELGFSEMRRVLDKKVTGVLEAEQKPIEPIPKEVAPEVAPKAPPKLASSLHIGRELEANPDDPVLLARHAELIYDEIRTGVPRHLTSEQWSADQDLSAAKHFWVENYGRYPAGKEAIDRAEIAKVKLEASKPEVVPKAEIPKEEPEILAEEITLGVEPPTKPPIPPTPPPREMPEFGAEPERDPVTRLNELIKAAKPLRKKLEKAYTAERGKRIAEVDKFIQETIDTVGGEEGYKMILSKLKGELAPPEMKVAFEPLKDKLSAEELKSLYIRTWKHPYLDNWEKVSAADGLTNLLMGGIPQPKKLVLLEEIYGSELIKNILSKRVWGAKATDFLVEAGNVPRALLATADMSAFLRQGVIELAAHPVVSAKAIGKTFQFAFDPIWGGRSFEQYFEDLYKDPLYPVMRKSGLSITDPSRAGMQEREEAFISRILQKIPVVKVPVEFAERAYVGFLNKVRVDLFKTWSDELVSKGHTPTKDPELFKSAADVVNTFTGRGSLGKAGNRITPQLNTLFFSPRLIAARFNALNPVWYAKQPKEIRKKAIGDFAKYVVAGLTVLALVKTYKEATGASDEELSVETDTRSSDSGKIRIGNTRFDIWGGFQQWVRVFTQLVMGQRKNTKTGEIISLNKEEYPFTTRKEVLLRFMEGKLAPVPQLVNELISGAKTFGGEDITAGYITKSKFVPMYIQDIAEAYTDGGLGRAVGVSIPAFFGVGVQTWLPRKKKKKKRTIW